MMLPLSHRLYTSEQIRLLDKMAIEKAGIASMELMSRAANAAWQTLLDCFIDVNEVVVFCGGGNNAGDGYLLATLAAQQWMPVTVWQLVDEIHLKNDALSALKQAQRQGVTIKPFSQYTPPTNSHAVMVDALLGIGLRNDVQGEFKKAIQTINHSAHPVLAIDIPSGLCADTGAIKGMAVNADTTITFIGIKRGLFTADGFDCAGEVIVNDLAVPAFIFEEVTSVIELLDYEAVQSLLTWRSHNSHKGDFGHVLVVGGDYGMGGAVMMAAEAALRAGAGRVSVATRAEHTAPMLAYRPEFMPHAVEHLEQLQPLLAKATVVVLGPGLGQSSWSQGLWQMAIDSGLPLVVDADGLSHLVQSNVSARSNWILTPHPGEAARLLKTTTAVIQSDRFSSATALYKQYGGAVVLKGAGSVLCYSHDLETSLAVCGEGNPGMATAGMGDVLSGLLGGLLAQGWSVVDTLRLGVCIHAAAGDLASLQGERGLIATDLMLPIQHLVNGLE